VDEWELRALAVALRPELPRLLGEDRAAELDRQLGAALDLTPGRAKAVLRRLLLLTAAAPVREWVQARLPGEVDTFRLTDLPERRAQAPGRADLGARPRDAWSPVDGQVLSLRIPEHEDDPGLPFIEGRSYTAIFMAGEDVAGNYLVGQATADLGDLDSLATRWVVVSRTVRLAALGPDVTVDTVEAGRDQQWIAVFSLDIPASGNSAERRLTLTPLAAPEARVDVLIYVGDDVYRELTASLKVGLAPPEQGGLTGVALTVITDQVLPAAHTGLRSASEWQRAARKLDISVAGDQAVITCQDEDFTECVPWRPRQDAVMTYIETVRESLGRLRDSAPEYFDLIDADGLLPAVARYRPPEHWTAAGPASGDAWSALAVSRELARLAYDGNLLYRAVFGEEVRKLIERKLKHPGDRLKLTWRDDRGGWVPYLPLPLMYLDEPPEPGQPVDPTRFLGLRYRLGYVARRAPQPRGLGDWSKTTRAHLLYWGGGQDDSVAAEARRHRRELSTWPPTVLLPGDGPPDARSLASYLRDPKPAPVSLLYFYCHCRGGSGRDPVLRFGSETGEDSELALYDIGSSPLEDAPIVFVNACATNASEPLLANPLRELFFQRNCRAYIGTEAEVPAGLAARFATAFFSFLYGTDWRGIAPVGEAIAQARRFLWTEYQNIGGLFYNYVNDYALFAADDATVAGLRSAHPGRADA
jgi:hypothetical protein